MVIEHTDYRAFCADLLARMSERMPSTDAGVGVWIGTWLAYASIAMQQVELLADKYREIHPEAADAWRATAIGEFARLTRAEITAAMEAYGTTNEGARA